MPHALSPKCFGTGAPPCPKQSSSLAVLLGAGEPLFAGIDLPKLDYTCEKVKAGECATFYRITRA